MLIVLRRAKGTDQGGNYFYQIPSCKRFIMPEIYRLMRSGHQFTFADGNEDQVLLSLIHKFDKATTDVKLLNRIIRNGGLIEYAKSLESRYVTEARPA